MGNEIQMLVAAVQLGVAQTYKNVTVVPLCLAGDGGPVYLTMGEAIGSGLLVVTELSQAGSVPDLKVVNRADLPVLFLDGEELIGAKQNRVLNTSILMKANSETVVPVSCTEQGRWSHVSPAFADSGVHMSHKVRLRKTSSVSESLASTSSYHSDQAGIWAGIAALHADVGTSSPTSAMRAAFEGRQAELEQGVKAFTRVPEQHGLLVLIDGAVAGLDVVSRAQAYERLHSKLIKSYLIEALVAPRPVTLDAVQAHERARLFLEEIGQCEERRFDSIGHGFDLRFKKAGMAGTALAHEGCVIHGAFFRLTPEEEMGSMASLRNRRRHV